MVRGYLASQGILTRLRVTRSVRGNSIGKSLLDWSWVTQSEVTQSEVIWSVKGYSFRGYMIGQGLKDYMVRVTRVLAGHTIFLFYFYTIAEHRKTHKKSKRGKGS